MAPLAKKDGRWRQLAGSRPAAFERSSMESGRARNATSIQRRADGYDLMIFFNRAKVSICARQCIMA